MSGFETNEISSKANGGTELYQRFLTEKLDPELLNNFQIVSSRIRELDPTKIRIFSGHDLALDPESMKFRDSKFINNFHKFVWISHYQYAQYRLVHGIPYNTKSSVLETCIKPAPLEALQKPTDIIRIVYTSTPQRGLEILVPVFIELAKIHPEIHLDVFSSFKIYGWDNADKEFETLYDVIRNHPQMTYHGFVSNDQLREHLNKSHIFAYPSIWEETSCRSMIESMSAGLICVHPSYGALPETSGMLNMMYQGDFDDKMTHSNIFMNYLNGAIDVVKKNQYEQVISYIKYYTDMRYNQDNIVRQWELMLKQLLEKYQDESSRRISNFPEVIYRT
jgi:UDP-glucose:(glucosyl)LPS alpha-1,2-glucosyltransferase